MGDFMSGADLLLPRDTYTLICQPPRETGVINCLNLFAGFLCHYISKDLVPLVWTL